MQIVIVLIGISFITFALTFMSPGDPVRNMYTATGVMPTEREDGAGNKAGAWTERSVSYAVYKMAWKLPER